MVTPVQRAADRVLRGERLDREDARALWEEADDSLLQQLASHARARFHPPDRA